MLVHAHADPVTSDRSRDWTAAVGGIVRCCRFTFQGRYTTKIIWRGKKEKGDFCFVLVASFQYECVCMPMCLSLNTGQALYSRLGVTREMFITKLRQVFFCFGGRLPSFSIRKLQ